MNGRIYDPYIGRFMSADPYIQAPYELQSHNRYAYVMNNPLLYTDPSGYWSWKQIAIIVVVIVATVVTMGAVAAYMGFASIASAGTSLMASIAMGAAGGFVGGFLSTALNGGSFKDSMKAGIIGGITGAAMGYVGFSYAGNTAGNYIGHAVVSCASSVASGGNSQSCGRAAAASLVGTFVSANTTNTNGWNQYSRGVATAVAGGVTSRMMGGSFADGATSAAYGYLFNSIAHDMVSGAGYGESTKIFLGFTPVADGYHTYVMAEADDGRQFVIRAGPGGDGNPISALASDASGYKSGGMGNITVTSGAAAYRTDVPDTVFRQYIGTVYQSIEKVVDSLLSFGAAVNAANIPYRPLSQNSNSFAAQAVTATGLPRAIPGAKAYGNETFLKVPCIITTKIAVCFLLY
jgi:hypothetical protein